MNAFLLTIAILFLVEVGASIGYWIVGDVPPRTLQGVLFNGILSAGLSCWALYLLMEKA